MPERPLKHPRARAQGHDLGRPSAYTGKVELWAFAGWLRSAPMATAELTLDEALTLARELTEAVRLVLKHQAESDRCR